MLSVMIYTSNDAFKPDPGPELARILRKLADDLEAGEVPRQRLMDENGNTVGRVALTKK